MNKHRYLVEALITDKDKNECQIHNYWYSCLDDIENDFKQGDLYKYSHICISDFGENFEYIDLPKTHMMYK